MLLGVTRSKDKIAEVAKDLGFEGLTADGKSKVLYWTSGETEPKVYDGTWCLLYTFRMSGLPTALCRYHEVRAPHQIFGGTSKGILAEGQRGAIMFLEDHY